MLISKLPVGANGSCPGWSSKGGSNGGNGMAGKNKDRSVGPAGQGFTTRAFGLNEGQLFSGGGGSHVCGGSGGGNNGGKLRLINYSWNAILKYFRPWRRWLRWRSIPR